METSFKQTTSNKVERYRLFLPQFELLISDEKEEISVLANTAAVSYTHLEFCVAQKTGRGQRMCTAHALIARMALLPQANPPHFRMCGPARPGGQLRRGERQPGLICPGQPWPCQRSWQSRLSCRRPDRQEPCGSVQCRQA